MANDLIMDSGNLAEITGHGTDEDEALSDLTATKSADPDTMDFHVQMRGYTMRDFETMVVHAAAQQLMGGRTFKAEIEAKAVEIASAKMNARLTDALKDVMGMTVSKRGAEPVTLGQMIGMEAKDYLTQPVGRDGKPNTDSWGSRGTPRIAYLVQQFVADHFAKEIKAGMEAMLAEVKAHAKAKLDQTIQAERERILASLGYEITAKR